MKTPKTQDEAQLLLTCLYEDFEAAMYGDWVPDEDSCFASMMLVKALMNYVKNLPKSRPL